MKPFNYHIPIRKFYFRVYPGRSGLLKIKWVLESAASQFLLTFCSVIVPGNPLQTGECTHLFPCDIVHRMAIGCEEELRGKRKKNVKRLAWRQTDRERGKEGRGKTTGKRCRTSI